MGKQVSAFLIRHYGELFDALQKRGFQVLGAMFVTDRDEVEQLYPAHFHVAGLSRGWNVWKIQQRWDQIAWAASKAGNLHLMQVASRLAVSFEQSEMRLLDVADAYGAQLRALVQREEAKEYLLFWDRNSPRVFKAIHAMFWELSVLRDALAEFTAMFCFGIPGVRRFRSLVAKLRASSISDPIAAALLSAADQASRGWIWLFSEYRNFFTHIAPLQQAANAAYTVQEMGELAGEIRVPQLYFPLPENIDRLAQNYPNGVSRLSLEELVKKRYRRPEARKSEPDALEYLHSSLNQYAELAESLIARSPIPPTPITLTADDFAGARVKFTATHS